MTPAQLRQPVKLKEGCSDNVTEVYVVYTARKDESVLRLLLNTDRTKNEDGEVLEYDLKPTGRLQFKKGQVWLLHDH